MYYAAKPDPRFGPPNISYQWNSDEEQFEPCLEQFKNQNCSYCRQKQPFVPKEEHHQHPHYHDKEQQRNRNLPCHRKTCLARGGCSHQQCDDHEHDVAKYQGQRQMQALEETTNIEDWGQSTDWPEGPDPEWMNTEAIPFTPIEPSQYAKCWEESFRKTQCPHGVQIYSPEDQCDQCIAECMEQPVVHVNLVKMDGPSNQNEPCVKVK